MYDVSIKFSDKTVPTVNKYNGDTSIYCPVSFRKGKLSVGFKEYAAVYQNRYYYMSSSKHLKVFMSNPVKYSSFTSNPKSYPKPKISLLFPFGLKAVDFTENLLNIFNDFTVIDSYTIFKRKVLSGNTPMLGKMYEQPALKNIMDKYFASTNQNLKYMNSLRKYVNRKSAYLSDEDWTKMNSIFYQTKESVFYKNYPRNLAELKYLKENITDIDIVIEVVADNEEKELKDAKNETIKNWLAYQYAVIEKVIEHDEITRQITASKKSTLFKNKLADFVNRNKIDRLKSRLKNIIDMIAIETEYGPEDAIHHKCQNEDQRTELPSKVNLTMSTLSNIQSRYSEMTLKQKKIIISYGLSAENLLGLDNFETLESIDVDVDDELPKDEYLISKIFLDTLEHPSDAMVANHLKTEKTDLDDMRKFAQSSGIPWITTVLSAEGPDLNSAALYNEIARLLPGGGGDNDIFETTFAVDMDEAERMLRTGEVYLSQYGRWCPVWARKENSVTAVQRFYSDSVEGRVCPVIHRKYAYFLSGSEHRDEFIRWPLRYAFRPFSAPDNVALRLAVVGPPGTGKSRTAARLCDRYGLQLVRVEQAVDSYLTAAGWTDDARSAVHGLSNGNVLTDFTLVEAVKMAVQTPRAIVSGYVLDGFPTTENQFRLLDNAGIILHRVFVLQNRTVPVGASSDCDHVPVALLQYRRQAWNEAFVGLDWISGRYCNVSTIGTDGGDDQTVTDAAVRKVVGSAREYIMAVRKGRPVRLTGIAVTGRECRNRVSTFLNLCPVCRVDDNCLNEWPDNEPPYGPAWNLVQYRSFFYRLCPIHWEAFAAEPDRYADRAPRQAEPTPVRVTYTELSENCLAKSETVSAYCVVCALRRLWDPIYRRGNREHTVMYENRRYALCSAKCRCDFTRRPFAYNEYAMYVREPAENDPAHRVDRDGRMDVDGLPTLGYLEQTVARPVGDALTTLSAMKPIYPGLSADVTAMVYLGLHIGMHGSRDDDVTAYYRDAFRRFVDTCYGFKTEVFKLKLVT